MHFRESTIEKKGLAPGYQECIDACLECASVCDYCASSCLQENDVKMLANCIKTDMECSAICYTTAQILSYGSRNVREICEICAYICDQCAEECDKHKNMEHCQVCAEACRECARACRSIL